ncbi:YopX family protein, partial [Enterococcus faecium]
MAMIPKFRAWDREKDRMIYPSTTGVCFEMNDDGISVLDIDVDYPNDYGFPKIASILMQSTGLKDKNGV